MFFEYPWFLLLLPVPFLIVRFLPPETSETAAVDVPESIAVRFSSSSSAFNAISHSMLVPALIWAGLVCALASPRSLAPQTALPANGRDIILALDLSGSMEQKDFQLDGKPATRLDALKSVAANFVRGRAGDRIGLVVFAETAYYAAAPSFDTEAVARAIEQATIGISGRSTAISEGLGLSLKRLKDSKAASRIVILLSDGVNNGGTVRPDEAAALAERLGIKVHTIAMGVLELDEAEDKSDAVDTGTLAAIAAASGGKAFRVKTTADLKQVISEIGELETSAIDTPPVEVFRDHWHWPAGLALVLALLFPVLRRGSHW